MNHSNNDRPDKGKGTQIVLTRIYPMDPNLIASQLIQNVDDSTFTALKPLNNDAETKANEMQEDEQVTSSCVDPTDRSIICSLEKWLGADRQQQ
jgi:hypothetical protein